MKTKRLAALAATIALFVSNTAAVAETWIPLSLTTDWNLRITEGSALDFSTMFVDTDMSKRVGVKSTGELTEIGGREQRYLCAPMAFTSTQGYFPEEAEAREMAVQLRRHGYNLVRIQYLDAALMGAPDSTAVDYGFSPTQIAKFQYFLQQLKLNGIRWNMDVATSRYGAYGDVGGARFPTKGDPLFASHDLNLEVHYDDDARDPSSAVNHWKGLIDKMMNLPMLGGGSLLNDTGTIAITLVNEMDLNFSLSKDYPLPLQERFKAATGSTSVPPYKMDKADYGNDLAAQALAKLMQRFITQTETSTTNWMKNYLATASHTRPAYLGLTTAYNVGKGAQSYAARLNQELVAVHGYYDMAKDEETTQSLEMTSSFADALPYVGYFGVARNLNKPFIVDEHHQPYMSPYRRESGLAFPAYAAFQDWDGICRFANPVQLEYEAASRVPRRKHLDFYNVGFDPVARAGETLSALIYRRGDVKKGTYRAPVVLGETFLHSPWSAKTPMPYGINRLALVTAVGSVREGYVPDPASDVDPWILKESSLNGAMVDSIQLPLWEKTLANLKTKQRARGWPQNTSDFATRKYVTDTGEITLNELAKTLLVKTDRTEAVVFPDASPMPLTLTKLKIVSADSGALVSASSLTDQAVKDSTRVLLIVATDARSTDAVFTPLGKGRVELTDRGRMPVEIRSINLALSLKHSGRSTGFKLYALSLTGDRIAELPLGVRTLTEGGFEFDIRIDTSRIRDAAGNPRITTYFEIVKN